MTVERAITFPEWVWKLARRLLGLEAGRYLILFTVGEHGYRDWTVIQAGKVEQA